MTARAPWMTTLTRKAAGVVVVALGALSVGCGRYESELAYPEPYADPAPRPMTAAELVAAQQARAEAQAETREIVIGAESDPAEYTDADPSALTEFRPALDGHGAWVDDDTYGTVWVPAATEVGTDFQPYVSAGHWTYSDEADYVWVSDYSWGWAPFHYGRWVSLPRHGWSWIPGRRYAGAWVTWRTGAAGYGYVGWAPAPPTWYWYRGGAYGWSYGGYHHYDHYVYCPHDYVYHGAVSTHVVRGPGAQEHYGRTHDYVPASPTVAAPERHLATPTVGGSERVVATPTVGTGPGSGNSGRIGSSSRRGPRPDELGQKSETVVAPPSSHEGLGRARALAVPSRPVITTGPPPSAVAMRPSPFIDHAGRGPASNAFVPSARAPVPSPAYRSSSDSYASSSRSARAFGTSSSFPSAPSFRSSPSPAPTPSPTFRSSAPSSVSAFRSQPAPTFRSSPSPSVGAMRSSSPSVSPRSTFRSSAPSSAGAIRSSPSVRATPSVRSSSSVSKKR